MLFNPLVRPRFNALLDPLLRLLVARSVRLPDSRCFVQPRCRFPSQRIFPLKRCFGAVSRSFRAPLFVTPAVPVATLPVAAATAILVAVALRPLLLGLRLLLSWLR